MLTILAAAVLAPQGPFDKPEMWALGIAGSPKQGFVGDVDGDGRSDLIAINLAGDASIDVALTVEGVKPGGPQNVLDHWGPGCLAVAVGPFEGGTKTDVVGLFGAELRLAGGFKNGHYSSTPNWVKLPHVLNNPVLASLDGGKSILAFSTRDGSAFRIDTSGRTVTECHVPGGLAWIGDEGDKLVGETNRGDVEWLDKTTYAAGDKLGEISKNSRPAAGQGVVAFGDHVWTPAGVQTLESEEMPKADETYALGPVTGSVPDLIAFRYGTEAHTGNEVILHRAVANGPQVDSSNDGIPDDWKLNGFRGMDFKALGCKPGHADIVCLISRFDGVTEQTLKRGIDRVVAYYASLKVKNPDGTTGIHLHPVYLPPVTDKDTDNPWWVNRDKFRPAKWRGVVHWMQVTPGGGGQADELSDGGTCGQGALWAVFTHEFGHQMGLPHTGFWPVDFCPIYSSLMNYNYSYSFEGSRDNVHYSDGSLSALVLHQNDLDEVLPFPYEKVKFLADAPYHYHLKANGDTTLIDWNWNGVFGEHHVRANINYAYGLNAGERFSTGKTHTAPWLMTYKGTPYIFYGTNDAPEVAKTDPTLSATNPGRLEVRHLVKEKTWSLPTTIEVGGLIGDPVAAEYRGQIYAVYQTQSGVVMRRINVEKDGLTMSQPTTLSENGTLVPTIGVYNGSLYVFFWNPSGNVVTYKVIGEGSKVEGEFILDALSTSPVGICTNSITGEAVIGLAQDEGSKKRRWQIRKYKAEQGKLVASGPLEWVGGPTANDHGFGRITALFQTGKDAGPQGRVYLLCSGDHGKDPWACEYMCQQITDKTMHGGWLVKRYNDEWTQSRSAPTAVWYKNDLIYCYRWIDGGYGQSDNKMDIAYDGLGISDLPFGDFDDLSFIRNFGVKNSIIWLNRQ